MPATRKSAARNGSTKTVRNLKKEIEILKKELEKQRRFNRQLARKVLPPCPKSIEDQIPSVEEIRKLAAQRPTILEIIESLK